MTDEQQIRALIEAWAIAAHDGDLDTVLADHSPVIPSSASGSPSGCARPAAAGSSSTSTTRSRTRAAHPRPRQSTRASSAEGGMPPLERPRRLACTWLWNSTALGTGDQFVEVEFIDNGADTTTVVLFSTGLTEADEHDHRSGWEASFDNLDSVLAARR